MRLAMLNQVMGAVKTRRNLARHRGRPYRALEIGPGEHRLENFETLNIMPGPSTDYCWDASRRLPFDDNSLDLIYASHVLEHIPWYRTRTVLTDWVRVLKPGGALELWVPDGLKIASAFVESESAGTCTHGDAWWRYNPEKDPCQWAAGRMFTYGDGSGDPGHPNWHRALFSPRYLEQLLRTAGLIDVQPMTAQQVRGYDHGWINLGMRGTKP